MSDQPILDTTKLDPNAKAAEMSGEPIKGPKTCPLNVDKIQLLPLRYALVENLQPETNILNKAKSVSEQAPLFTQLTSHPVGIRFMRYGWLYVYKYNTQQPVILGFKIQGSRIVQGTKIDQEGNKTDYQPALIIDKNIDIQIRICFSEEEWTTNKAKQVIANEAQRQLLMYPIVVGNLSCDFQSANILTKEQAPSNIADVAEKHITQPNCYHNDEDKPYVWIDKRTTFTQHDQLGKLNQQLTNDEGKQGHYAYIVVPDPIGMMLDLAAEQEKIVYWRQTWGEKTQSRGTNEFLYTMAHYINGLLSISDTSAEKYGENTDKWLTKLTAEQRQSIYDYINTSNQNERVDRDRTPNKAYSYTFGYLLNNFRSDQSVATDQEIFQEEVSQEIGREKQSKDLEYIMIEKLGGTNKYFNEYSKKVEGLKEQHYTENYGSYVLGKQGTIDVVNQGALNGFLDKNDAYIKKWSEQLDKITQDRIFLFTKYFHNATWYFDGDSDDQNFGLQKIEAACVIGMVRNQTAIASLKAFFNEYPYYLLPGYHISSYNYEVIQMGAKFKGLLNDTASFIKVLKTLNVEDDVNIAQAFPKNYWRKMINFGSNSSVPADSELASFRHTIEDVYGTAAMSSLNEAINENIERIPEKIQNRIKTTSGNIADAFDDLKKVDFGGRTALFAGVKSQGLLFVENDPIKQHNLQIEFGRIYNQLKGLKNLSNFIDEQSAKLGEKITKPDGGSADRYEGVEREQINKDIGIAKKKFIAGAMQLDRDCYNLADKFAPVDNDQMPFTLKSTDASHRINYSQIAEFEKKFRGGWGFARMATMNPGSIMRSAALPAALTYFQGKGMMEAWSNAVKNNYAIKDMAIFTGAFFGTLSSAQSTLQAIYTTMVQNAIAKITVQAEAATGAKVGGARLATKLGKFSLVTGSLAQYAGFISSAVNIYQHNGEWLDAMGKGDSKLSAAAAGVMFTNYGTQAFGTMAVGYTTVSIAKMRRRLQLLRGLYEAEKITNLANATSRAWAVRGLAFNSRIALLAKPTVVLALLQFGAEYAYNRYNLNDTLRWVKYSVWGNDDQGWDEKQHYQQISKTISEPAIVYLGEQTEILYDPPNSKSQAYRYLHLVLKGQTYATLAKNSVQWEAGWVPEWQKGDRYYTGDAIPEAELTELLKKNATIVGHDPLIIQFKLPLNRTEGYKWPLETVRKRQLVLRLWYTPDNATEQLGKAVKHTFSIDLPIDETTLKAPKVIAVTKDNRFYKYFTGKYKTEFTQADDQNKLV